MPPCRIIVTTDPELDDLNSMLRLLLYSNEVDIAALVYSASNVHHRGNRARGVPAHRWPAAGDRLHIDLAVDAYESAYDNLVRHDPHYPAPADLRACPFGYVLRADHRRAGISARSGTGLRAGYLCALVVANLGVLTRCAPATGHYSARCGREIR